MPKGLQHIDRSFILYTVNDDFVPVKYVKNPVLAINTHRALTLQWANQRFADFNFGISFAKTSWAYLALYILQNFIFIKKNATFAFL